MIGPQQQVFDQIYSVTWRVWPNSFATDGRLFALSLLHSLMYDK